VPKHHRHRPEATKILLKRVGWKSSFEFVELQQEFSATMVLAGPPEAFLLADAFLLLAAGCVLRTGFD
jgi:hypothetical protein